MSARGDPVKIKNVMVKLGGGILFLLLAGFLIEAILDIDIANQCRLHYDEKTSVQTVFGLVVEGEKKIIECIQYSENIKEIEKYVSDDGTEKMELDANDDRDKYKRIVTSREITITNTCISPNGTSITCETVGTGYQWSEKVNSLESPGPYCDKDDTPPECVNNKRYHAQDKPVPMMIFGLNVFLIIVALVTIIGSGYKLILYVKQAPK